MLVIISSRYGKFWIAKCLSKTIFVLLEILILKLQNYLIYTICKISSKIQLFLKILKTQLVSVWSLQIPQRENRDLYRLKNNFLKWQISVRFL